MVVCRVVCSRVASVLLVRVTICLMDWRRGSSLVVGCLGGAVDSWEAAAAVVGSGADDCSDMVFVVRM